MCDAFQDGQPHLFTDIDCSGDALTFTLEHKTSLKTDPLVSWVVPKTYSLQLFVGDSVYTASGTMGQNDQKPMSDAEYFLLSRNDKLANSNTSSRTSNSCGTTYTETQNITIIVILSLVLLTILGFAVGYYLMSKRQEEKQNRLLAKVNRLKRAK